MTIQIIKKNLIALCSVVAIILFGVTVKDYMILDEARVKKQEKEADLVSVQKDIVDIQEALDRYEAEKKEFRKYLFEEKDVPAFLEGISKYAAESAINVVDMKTKKFQEVATAADQKPSRSKYGTRRQGTKTEATPDEKLERALTLAAMPISIKVKGTFSDFVQFLGHLEDFKQLITVSNVEIDSRRSDYPLLNCAFTLKIYSFKTIEELEYK